MTLQKFIEYTPIQITGQKLDSSYLLKVNISNESGNYLIHKDILRQWQSKRQGTSSTKTRGEVRGGGKKPWRQKGTGRARAGSNRSPLWKGGGVIFGPKPNSSKLKLNKQERRLALRTLLYNKKNKIVVIEDFENNFKEKKTKEFIKVCEKCSINLQKKLLIIVSEKTMSLKLSTHNIKNVELILASNLNTLSLISAEQILLTPPALKTIKEIYCD